MSSIPVTDPSVDPRQAITISGELPSPIAPPSGCRFRTRCPRATERVRRRGAVLRELRGGQLRGLPPPGRDVADRRARGPHGRRGRGPGPRRRAPDGAAVALVDPGSGGTRWRGPGHRRLANGRARWRSCGPPCPSWARTATRGLDARDGGRGPAVSVAAIYYHFPSKHDLLREFLDDSWRHRARSHRPPAGAPPRTPRPPASTRSWAP